LLFIINIIFAEGNSSYIVLNDGNEAYGTIKIADNIFKQIIIFNDSIIYSIDDIKFYKNEHGYFGRVNNWRGNVGFAIRTTEGIIDIYSLIRRKIETQNPDMYPYPMGVEPIIKENPYKEIKYFSVGNRELKRLTYLNVRNEFGAMKINISYLSEIKPIYQFQNAALIFGFGTALYSLYTENIGGLTISGISLLSSWISSIMIEKKLNEFVIKLNNI